MPAIAVIGAGAALFGGGAAAIGAVVAGTATLATTLTAVAAVGAVVGAVGAVTGDKTLSTVGMVMGGIGGIGAIAANAGVFGAAATTESLFGSSAAAADALGPVSVTPIAQGVKDAFTSTGIVDALGGVSATTATSAINDGLQAATGAAKALAPAPAAAAPTTTANGMPVTPGLDAGPAKSAGLINTPTGMEQPVASRAPQVQAVAAPQAPNLESVKTMPELPQESGGIFGALKDFVSDDKTGMVKLGMIQAGGSLIGGLFDPLPAAQVAALEAQSKANRAAASLDEQRASAMSAPIPVARRTPRPAVTGAPAGMINQAAGASA